jgi:hypothetical protein
MLMTTSSIEKLKPWDKYGKGSRSQGQDRLSWKLLQPGWGGELADDEFQFILSRLQSDEALSFWWGFRPRTKRRPIEGIKAVAMWGDPEVRARNVKLVRPHQYPVATQLALPWG